MLRTQQNPAFLFHYFFCCWGDCKWYSFGRLFLLFLYKSLNPSLPGTIWQMLLQSVQQMSLDSEMFSHMKGSLTNEVLCWTTKRRGMLHLKIAHGKCFAAAEYWVQNFHQNPSTFQKPLTGFPLLSNEFITCNRQSKVFSH